MRKHQNKIQNSLERNALSLREELSPISKENADKHNQQLHEIVLKKQKVIIYLSIVYTLFVIGSIIYLIFLK
ncbi:MAG: hypothetical protein ACUVRG_00415 [Ignavibacterium sp.]|uniref:hypothetical protein n=1 Tax=Ignavibacterium sp. TaxID=2651167 RepID=UPI004048ED8E